MFEAQISKNYINTRLDIMCNFFKAINIEKHTRIW